MFTRWYSSLPGTFELVLAIGHGMSWLNKPTVTLTKGVALRRKLPRRLRSISETFSATADFFATSMRGNLGLVGSLLRHLFAQKMVVYSPSLRIFLVERYNGCLPNGLGATLLCPTYCNAYYICCKYPLVI